jgi:hypothetical protein
MKAMYVWLLLTLFVVSAAGADVTGTWKATVETPNGNVERTFVFKTEGSKVTGETSSQMTGKSEITDGKLEGDTLTFTITAKFGDQDMKLKYTGKVGDKEIKFHVESMNGEFALDYTAKKVS